MPIQSKETRKKRPYGGNNDVSDDGGLSLDMASTPGVEEAGANLNRALQYADMFINAARDEINNKQKRSRKKEGDCSC